MPYEVIFYWDDKRFANLIVSAMSLEELQDYYEAKDYDFVEVRPVTDDEMESAVMSGRPVIEIGSGIPAAAF